MEVAVACAREKISCALTLCMMPEGELRRCLEPRLAPGQRPYLTAMIQVRATPRGPLYREST